MSDYHSSSNTPIFNGTGEEGILQRRIAIGYFAVNIHDNIGSAVFDGISTQCREYGIDLVTFKGEKVGNPEITVPNFIYEMASRNNIDGLIVWPVTLAYDTKNPEHLNYYKRFLDIPVVCIGMSTPETPSVTIDNHHGIRLVMEHIIKKHHVKKIAYINATEGHAYAEARFDAYKRILDEYGLEYDERLVSPYADFSEQTGIAAIDRFIMQHRLVPGKDMDAIVTASDMIAAGAMKQLGKYGFRVPDDIIVTGFNNTLISRAVYPGITTIGPNFTDHGRKAVDILLSVINGKNTAGAVRMPVREVIRQSCGCLEEVSGKQPEAMPEPGGENPLKLLTPENAENIIRAVKSGLEIGNEEQMTVVSEVLDAYIKDLLHLSNKTFLSVYARAINTGTVRNSNFLNLYNILYLVRKKLLPLLPDEKSRSYAETLLYNARMITDSKFDSVKEEMRSQQIILSDSLPAFGSVLNSMNDYRSLFDAFEKMLIKIGIKECFISLFESEDCTSGFSRLFFAFADGKRIVMDKEGYRYETGELIPKLYDSDGRRTNRIYLPLYYNQYTFGFVAFEFSDYLRSIYGSVARILSSSLFGLKINGEREKTHETIKESERRFRSMIETSNDWIWEVDENLIYKYCSPMLQAITGFEQEEVLGKSMLEFLYKGDLHNIALFMNNFVLNRNQVKNLEFKYLRRDGSLLIIETSALPVFVGEHGFKGFQGVHRDITERKEAENEKEKLLLALETRNVDLEKLVEERTRDIMETNIKLKKAIEEANKASIAKSYFLANMSHELRTPINGINGFINLLERTGLNAEQTDYVMEAKKASDMLLGVISDILDYSKIEAGRLELERLEFSISELIDDCIALFIYSGAAKGIEMAARTSGAVPCKVFGDPVRLKQVVANLLSNALKFTERGHILLTADLEAVNDGRVVVRFSVEDTGIGIYEEDIKKLFVVFSQVDASTTRKYGGTGLGLSISQRLVSMMNGAFSVDSKPGEGSCFSFTAEFEEACGEYPPEYLLQAGAVRGRLVLAFLRESISNRILLDYLREAELSVCPMHYANGKWTPPRDVVLQELKPDIVLLDENGTEDAAVLAYIDSLKGEGRENSRFILVAGFPARQSGEPSGREKGYACLYQPIKRAELIKSLYAAVTPPQEQPAVETKKEGEDEAEEDLSRLRVLLAEDSRANQKFLVKLLEKYRLRPDLAENGREAVELCGKNVYDVVLMDCQMPEVDGFEATRRIRRSMGINKQTPIIAITADAMEGDREKCLEAGMNDYITKPIDIRVLIVKLKGYASSPH